MYVHFSLCMKYFRPCLANLLFPSLSPSSVEEPLSFVVDSFSVLGVIEDFIRALERTVLGTKNKQQDWNWNSLHWVPTYNIPFNVGSENVLNQSKHVINKNAVATIFCLNYLHAKNVSLNPTIKTPGSFQTNSYDRNKRFSYLGKNIGLFCKWSLTSVDTSSLPTNFSTYSFHFWN